MSVKRKVSLTSHLAAVIDEISYMETNRCNSVALRIVELFYGGISIKIGHRHSNDAL